MRRIVGGMLVLMLSLSAAAAYGKGQDKPTTARTERFKNSSPWKQGEEFFAFTMPQALRVCV